MHEEPAERGLGRRFSKRDLSPQTALRSLASPNVSSVLRHGACISVWFTKKNNTIEMVSYAPYAKNHKEQSHHARQTPLILASSYLKFERK